MSSRSRRDPLDILTEMVCIRDAQAQVREFHEALAQPAPLGPARVSLERLTARVDWMQEELAELLEARTVVDRVDALADLVYIALGTAVEMGIPLGPVFELVHEANLRKSDRDGSGRLRGDGKILKPEVWVPPEREIAQWLVSAFTPYGLVVAEPSQCVAACVAMASARLGIDLSVGQVDDALPPTVAAVEGVRPQDVGVHLAAEPLSRYLRSIAPELNDAFYAVSVLDEASFGGFLRHECDSGRVPLVGVDASVIYPDLPRFGHFLLVASVTSDWTAILVDPGPATAGITLVGIDDLYAAVHASEHGLHVLSRDAVRAVTGG